MERFSKLTDKFKQLDPPWLKSTRTTDGRRVNRKSELNGSFEPTLGFQVIFWIPEDHETIADCELSKLTRNALLPHGLDLEQTHSERWIKPPPSTKVSLQRDSPFKKSSRAEGSEDLIIFRAYGETWS